MHRKTIEIWTGATTHTRYIETLAITDSAIMDLQCIFVNVFQITDRSMVVHEYVYYALQNVIVTKMYKLVTWGGGGFINKISKIKCPTNNNDLTVIDLLHLNNCLCLYFIETFFLALHYFKWCT